MKKLIIIILVIFGLYSIYYNNWFKSKEWIDGFIGDVQVYIKDYKQEVVVPENNQYRTPNSYYFVSVTEDYIPDSKQELYNIYYTVLNSGWDTFTFYCGKEYTNCINDVESLGQDESILSHFNSFVHPYNGFDRIKTGYYPNSGKVTLTIEKIYSKEKIAAIDAKVDEIFNQLYNPSLSTKDNIKKFHDYIINHSKYDKLKSTNPEDKTYESNNAYGPLFQGYAICSGYTDLMALFLNKMNLTSIKIATNLHVWNLVYLNDKWFHLDLTWDDPVTSNNKDMLIYNYFLIDYQKLKLLDKTEHNFDESIYKEALN